MLFSKTRKRIAAAVTIGRCTRCRGAVTVVTVCTVEAYAGDRAAVEARLCDPCRDAIVRAIVTPVEDRAPLTVVYQ